MAVAGSPYSDQPGVPGIPRIRMDAFNDGWRLFQQNMGVWIPAILIYGAIIFGISFVVGMVTGMGAAGQQRNAPPNPAMMGGQLLVQIVIWIISTMLLGGLVRMAIRQVRGESISVGDMFNVGDVLPALLGASILTTLATYVGFLCCIIPGLLINAILMWTVPLIVDRRMGATDAMSLSWNTLKPVMWTALGFQIVLGLVAAAGLIACGIGILFTGPMALLAMVVVYNENMGGGTPVGAYSTPDPLSSAPIPEVGDSTTNRSDTTPGGGPEYKSF